MELILTHWENFARTINPPALTMDSEDLRDHAELMLKTIAADLESKQTNLEQSEKSKGLEPTNPKETAAEKHAEARLQSGYTMGQLVSEYRALRASVLHLWHKNSKDGLFTDPEDITRFNEAIDQAVAESVERYSRLLKNSQDMFLAILSHDLRNPLNTTMVSSMILMRYDDVGDKVLSAAQRIYNSSLRMSRLINDLLDYTRRQLEKSLPISLAPANMAKICKNIIQEQQSVNPDRTIILKIDGSFDGIWDQERLSQVFSNLLGNAIEHGDKNSQILVELKGMENSVVIKINNKGQPISATEIQNIFKPLISFEKSDDINHSKKTHLGLGLYIAHEIITAHNGTIDVTSNMAEGTTFTIDLPRSHMAQ